MKRMNAVFDFERGVGYPASWSDEQVRLANHALKNADTLADALEYIVMNAEDLAFESWLDKNHPSGDVSDVQYKFERSSEFKEFIDEFELAKKALAAYRGEK
jgi:hypothetical protein